MTWAGICGTSSRKRDGARDLRREMTDEELLQSDLLAKALELKSATRLTRPRRRWLARRFGPAVHPELDEDRTFEAKLMRLVGRPIMAPSAQCD